MPSIIGTPSVHPKVSPLEWNPHNQVFGTESPLKVARLWGYNPYYNGKGETFPFIEAKDP